MKPIVSHCAIHGSLEVKPEDLTLVVCVPGASFVMHNCPKCPADALCDRNIPERVLLLLLKEGIVPAWDPSLEIEDLTDGAS